MLSWVEQTNERLQNNKCVVCGGNASVTYNLFPLCRTDDAILSRRINKSESYASTESEADISTAREICIDSPNAEVAACFVLVEYGGYDGLIRYLEPSEIELLEKDFPQVIRYLQAWDSRLSNAR